MVVIRGGELAQADLYGYDAVGSNISVNASDNTLIVDGFKGQVRSINNFSNIEFVNIAWENEGCVLEVGSTNLKDTAINIAGSTTLAGGAELNIGDYMYFIKNSGELSFETDPSKITSTPGIFTAGVAFEGTGVVMVDEDGSVKYEITSIGPSDQSNNIAQMNAASQALLIQANDLVVDGLNALEREQNYGLKWFAVGEGAYSKYEVGNELRINGWNGMVGAGDVFEQKNGDLSVAAFFEFGDANSRFNYDFGGKTHRTDSEFNYRGGGLSLRYRHDNGWYLDGSVRGGLMQTEAKNAFVNGMGEFFDHDVNVKYWSAHAGIGRVFEPVDSSKLDLFTRFFYTHFSGKSFTVDEDSFSLDSIESKQLRAGARWTFDLDHQVKWYLGTAWEYEFDAQSSGTANGKALESSALDGASVYAEVGFRYQRSVESPWDVEGRVRGYTGIREGVSGVLRATYAF